jgi:hypothetical protein
MGKYRKKPVVIEAWQFTGQDRMDWPEPFASDDRLRAVLFSGKSRVDAVEIVTLEGTMRADVNDFIIVGVKGEVYPCKPDIFEATYDTAE